MVSDITPSVYKYTCGILLVKRVRDWEGNMETTSRMERKKDARRESILKAAETIFLAKSYQNASMNDLADEADLTKKTLYSYFTCKEDIYYAVVARWYEALLVEIQKAAEETGTVFDRVMRGSRAYTRLYKQNPVIFSLMNNLESVRLVGGVDELAGKKRLAEIKQELFARMAALFDEGKKDGTIRGDIATQTLVASFIFTLTGFFLHALLERHEFRAIPPPRQGNVYRNERRAHRRFPQSRASEIDRGVETFFARVRPLEPPGLLERMGPGRESLLRLKRLPFPDAPGENNIVPIKIACAVSFSRMYIFRVYRALTAYLCIFHLDYCYRFRYPDFISEAMGLPAHSHAPSHMERWAPMRGKPLFLPVG